MCLSRRFIGATRPRTQQPGLARAFIRPIAGPKNHSCGRPPAFGHKGAISTVNIDYQTVRRGLSLILEGNLKGLNIACLARTACPRGDKPSPAPQRSGATAPVPAGTARQHRDRITKRPASCPLPRPPLYARLSTRCKHRRTSRRAGSEHSGPLCFVPHLTNHIQDRRRQPHGP